MAKTVRDYVGDGLKWYTVMRCRITSLTCTAICIALWLTVSLLFADALQAVTTFTKNLNEQAHDFIIGRAKASSSGGNEFIGDPYREHRWNGTTVIGDKLL